MENLYLISRKTGYTIVEFLNREFVLYKISNLARQFDTDFEKEPASNLVFDLRNVYYMDSTAFGFLINIRNKMVKSNKELAIVTDNDEIKHIMDMQNLDRFFKIFNKLEQAENYFKSQYI